MKKSYIILFLLLLLAACTHPDYPRLMAVADSLLYIRPDSALTILYGIPPDRLHTEEERMRHALLTVEAECRNGKRQSDDSIIRALVDYYQTQGNESMLARAYYGLGIVNNSLGRKDVAMTVFLTSERYARKAEDSKLLGRIYGNIGYLYQTNDMEVEADSLYHLAEQMARLAHDSAMLAEALTRQSMYLMELGKTYYPRAKRLLLEAYPIHKGSESKRQSIAMSLSLLYQLLQQPDSAIYYARRAVELCQRDTSGLYRAQCFLGNMFYQYGSIDSASFYYKQSSRSSSPVIKYAAFSQLSEIAKKEKNWKQALQLKDSASKYKALHENQKEPEKIITAEKNVEIHRYRSLWQGTKLSILYLVGGIFCLPILFFIIRWLRKKSSKKQTIPIQTPLLPSHSEIANIQEPLNYTEKDFEHFKQFIRQTMLWKKMERIIRYKEEHPDKPSVEKFTLTDQSAYLEEVRLILPDYLNRLHRCYPALSEKEDFKLCLYLSGMSVIHMGYVMERKRDTVYKQLQSIKEKKMLILEKIDLMQVLHHV